MPQYKINPDGSKTMLTRYSNKGVCGLRAIFPATPDTAKKLLKKKKSCEHVNLQKVYGVHDSGCLVRKIFARLMVKIMARVATGELFMMPGVTKAHITLKPIPDKYVRKMRKNGLYADYDIVRANFKIPSFQYDFGPYSSRKDVGVHVPRSIKQSALRNAENGLIAWTHIPKTFDRDVQYE